jgi:hypothetical protein
LENYREKQAKHALDILGRERFITFIYSLGQDQVCSAIISMNEDLESGHTVDNLFFTGEELGYALSVRKLGPDHFRIKFGGLFRPAVYDDDSFSGRIGDGGVWEVRFEPDGQGIHINPEELWMT